MTRDGSISNFLIKRSIFFALLGFGIIFLVANRAFVDSLEDSSKQVGNTVARTTFNTMYQIMSQGWSRDQLETFISQLEAGNVDAPLTINIYRGAPVNELFGQIDTQQADKEVTAAMQSGQITALNRGNGSRYLYPLVAEQKCLKCHTNVQAGDTLGLIDVKQNHSQQIEAAQAHLILYLLLASPVPIFLAWLAIHQIRTQMRESVETLSETIQKVESVADLPHLDLPSNDFRFNELNSIFGQVQQLGQKLRGIAVDKDLLEFEIRLLEKFVITSEVVRDWREYINFMLIDISQVIHAYTMFSIFKVDDEEFDLEVFWLNPPCPDSREAMERAIRKRLQQADSPFALSTIEVRHNIANSGGTEISLAEADIELQTKSLLVDTPKIGGIVGIGVHSDIVQDQTRRLVLESILSTMLNVVGSVKAIYKYTRDLEYYATRDPLTNLYNQRMFWELFEYELGRAERHDYPVALLMLDLDNFKTINDSYGHTCGDHLLAQLALYLEEHLETSDILARYGGDEFVLIMPETDLNKAQLRAEHLIEQLHSFSFRSPEGAQLKVTGSVGLGVYPEHANNGKELFMFVDNLMYRAKAAGKDQVSLPRDQDVIDLFREMNDKTRLVTEAIEEKTNLIPVFQPIQHNSDGHIGAVEVLSRIRMDDNQLMSAGEFIEIAESLGKVHELDYVIMDKAFAQVQQSGYQGLVFVNLSPRAVLVADFLKRIKQMVATHQLAAKQLVFEITERDTVKNLAVMEGFIQNLKDEGFGVAIDDFGSGFSSFHYLKHFPVDYVKIEGEFIANMAHSHKDKAFVHSIAQLAQDLHLETVAEFVESEEVLECVRAAKITYAQGYHIGRPHPDLAQLIAQSEAETAV